MSMVVRTNSMAMNANSALNKNNSTVAGNLQKLSTGFRINRAADDASGLAVSEKMKAQIKALDQAGKNAQDGASLIKTAEGYMGEIHDMLNRIVELAEKSANGTYETKEGGETYKSAATDRQAIQDEVDQLTTEIDRIAKTANFNNLKLLDGSLTEKVTYDDNDFNTATITNYDTEATEAKPGTALGDNHYTINSSTGVATKATGNAAKDTDYYTMQEATGLSAWADDTNYYTVTDGVATLVDQTEVTSPAGGTTYYTAQKDTSVKGPEDAVAAQKGDSVENFYVKDSEGNYTKASGTAKSDVTYYQLKDEADLTPTVTGGALKLQIGETSGDADKLEVSIMSFKTSDLLADLKTTTVDGGTENIVVKNESEAAKTAGIDGLTFNVSNQDAAALVAEKVRTVINTVSSQRATLGAMENRLDYTMNNLDTASQNITDANSRIRDTDMAKTMMEYTQGNTLTQAAQAMLAQANQAPSQVLQLLQ